MLPQMRGWFPFQRLPLAVPHGAPADAGMVLLRHHRRRPSFRCSRRCGDGSGDFGQVFLEHLVLPQMRGWFSAVGVMSVQRAGAPADAGMVRACSEWPCKILWCSRRRGDGSSSPRTVPARIFGAPADAGMVRSPSPSSRPTTRCSRRRGDGSGRRSSGGPVGRVLPETRGWFARGAVAIDPSDGAPADVGMVLAQWLRRRGDGPKAQAKAFLKRLVLPQTWGWSYARIPARARR